MDEGWIVQGRNNLRCFGIQVSYDIMDYGLSTNFIYRSLIHMIDASAAFRPIALTFLSPAFFPFACPVMKEERDDRTERVVSRAAKTITSTQ